MPLDTSDIAGDDFDDGWGVADTEEALALSFVHDVRLKDCIVAASVSVWGIPMVCSAQLEVWYCLLHPRHQNSFPSDVGGKTHILRTLGVIEDGLRERLALPLPSSKLHV